jgi:hypothetical protein
MTIQAAEKPQKDLVRYTMQLSRAAHDKIISMTKEFNISQAEVLEQVLLDLDVGLISDKLRSIRSNKLEVRAEKIAILAKLKKLSVNELINALSKVD